ncbi:unnamed protein product [Hydatigera taeniaeformis]|uniref:Small ribosomal subunit protein mS31 n=1 Tax=Hydatigena taeniaeformis TaxID=6205 RepID=A0A0R3WIE0_HYDTA|nr:unnamed protein product [Hydatigera taeniaeformis]
MLLDFPRQLSSLRSWVFIAARLYSSEGKLTRPTRRKGKSLSKERGRFQSTPSIAPPTSQLLEDFIVSKSRSTKEEGGSLEELGATGPPEHQKSSQLTPSRGIQVQPPDNDAIKFTLPLPAELNLFDETALEDPEYTDQPYNNEIFKEIEALESSAYRAKSTHNKFEELIQWTLDGKLWRYPIDNEQGNHLILWLLPFSLGWEEELTTPFHEHVFMDRLAKEQARSKKPPPLEAFMKLVCAGLGQNPYISVKEKRDHIAWFESYFSDKIKDIESAVEEEKRIAQAESRTRRTKPDS